MSVEFISFFIILFAGLFLSGVFNRLHLPWVAALLVTGIVIGPSGIDVFTPDATIEFIGEIGLVFLMFMAGIETKFERFKTVFKSSFLLAVLTSTIPFIFGFTISLFFGYSNMTAILLGIVFMSSSVAVIIPSLQRNGLITSKVGRTIVGATVIADILSLIFLSVLLQVSDPITSMPLPLFYILLFISLVLLRLAIPKIHYFFIYLSDGKDTFEREVRLVFTVMLGVVVLFQILGLHAIIAGFFAGFVLSESIENDIIKEKLHALSYGIFIPTFFVIVGANTDMSVFRDAGNAILLSVVIVTGLLLAKFASGFLSGHISGFNKSESSLIGVATMPQLSTTLAAMFTGFSIGLVDQKLLTAMILLSIITTFIVPIFVNILGPMVKKTYV